MCELRHNFARSWNLKRKPQLVGKGLQLSCVPKISFRNRPASSINFGHTNTYIHEPFGLGSFAMDDSQTKPASWALFIRSIR